jgi:hypothetical protein
MDLNGVMDTSCLGIIKIALIFENNMYLLLDVKCKIFMKLIPKPWELYI